MPGNYQLCYASGESREYGTITTAVEPIPPGTGYRDASIEAQKRGARLVACNSVQDALTSTASSNPLSGLVPIELRNSTGTVGLDCRPAEESDFPA